MKSTKAQDRQKFSLQATVKQVNIRILPGLRLIAAFPFTNFKLYQDISYNLDKLLSVDKAYVAIVKNLQDEYVSKETDGKFKLDENNLYVFESAAKRKAYFSKVEEIENQPANVQVYELLPEDLKAIMGKKIPQRDAHNMTVWQEFSPAHLADIAELIKGKTEEEDEGLKALTSKFAEISKKEEVEVTNNE